MSDTAKTISVILAIVAACFSAYFFLDGRYVHAEDVQQLQKSVIMLNQRLEIKIVKDKIDVIIGKMEKIEDKYGHKNEMQYKDLDKERYRELKKDLKDLNDQLNMLTGGKK